MFDPAARHHKALAARSIATIAEALTTLNAAVADCEKSRHQIDQDPAVLLLARTSVALPLKTGPNKPCCARPVWKPSPPSGKPRC